MTLPQLRADAMRGLDKIIPRFAHCFSSGGETRTLNPPVNSRMLCRLSYPRSRAIRGYRLGCQCATPGQLLRPHPGARGGAGCSAHIAPTAQRPAITRICLIDCAVTLGLGPDSLRGLA